MVRVYYEDTDFSGFVYHGSYLRFLERGRTELLRTVGFSNKEMAETEGVMFAVRSLQIDYVSPAFMDNLLRIETRNRACRRRLIRVCAACPSQRCRARFRESSSCDAARGPSVSHSCAPAPGIDDASVKPRHQSGAPRFERAVETRSKRIQALAEAELKIVNVAARRQGGDRLAKAIVIVVQYGHPLS